MVSKARLDHLRKQVKALAGRPNHQMDFSMSYDEEGRLTCVLCLGGYLGDGQFKGSNKSPFFRDELTGDSTALVDGRDSKVP